MTMLDAPHLAAGSDSAAYVAELHARLAQANARAAELHGRLVEVTAERDQLAERNRELASDLDSALDLASDHALDDRYERLAVVPDRPHYVNAFARAAAHENGYDR